MYDGMRPIRTGLSLAFTVAITYPLCALAFSLWPAGAFGFLSALFHGIDFEAMAKVADEPAAWTTFLAFCGIVAFAFAVGVVYAWMNNLVQGLASPCRKLAER